MKRRYLLLILILGLKQAIGQDSLTSSKPFNFKVNGFVKSDYWFDSRQVLHSREGLFLLYPLRPIYDSKNQDINSHPSFNFSAISSRINVLIEGPKTFGAKTTGFLEGDFTGISNATINTLRLRHAWIKWEWSKTKLTLGQDWHPTFVTDVFPGVLALNTGAPFQPFIRNPQVKLEYKYRNLDLLIAALSQRDNSCMGPIGRDFSYLSNSMIPNLHGRIQWNGNTHIVGLGIDWKSIVPRLITDSNLRINEKLNTQSLLVYHKYKKNNWQWKNKLIYGENLSEHLLLGGYAVASLDSATDMRTYTATRHLFAWTNLIYTKKLKKITLQPSIFIGYAKNLGTKESNIGIYYATGADIDELYRISPEISILTGPIMLTLEYEITRAYYGNLDAKGQVNNRLPSDNHRIMFAAFYFF